MKLSLDCRARRRGRAVGGCGGGGEGEGERVAVLRQLRRVHQVGHAAVPVHGRGARRVPPGVPGLRQVPPRRAPGRVPVHGPRPQLLPAALQRHRRPLTVTGRGNRPADQPPTPPTATGDGRILMASRPEMPASQPPFFVVN
uniref:Uncharacterized protein n=1 Tax=Triticum urartu TaxID=4572 RepID=A0A8R7QKY7_TRIUA